MISFEKGSIYNVFGKKREAVEILENNLSPYTIENRDQEYREDQNNSILVNEKDVEREAIKVAANRFKSIGISPNTGKLRRSSFNIKETASVPGSLSKKIVNATLVYTYSDPNVSKKTVKLAVKFDDSQNPKYFASKAVVDSENRRIEASSISKWFYTAKDSREVTDANHIEPNLAVFDGEKYIELDIENKDKVIANLRVAGIELQNRVEDEGLRHPFIEIVAYTPEIRSKVAKILREAGEADKHSEADMNVDYLSQEEQESENLTSDLKNLYSESLEVEDKHAEAMKDSDLDLVEALAIKRSALRESIKDLETRFAFLAKNIKNRKAKMPEKKEVEKAGNAAEEAKEEEDEKEGKKAEAGWFQKMMDTPILGPKQLAMVNYTDNILKSKSPTSTDISMLHSMLSSAIINDKKKEQIKQYLEKHEPFGGDNIIRAKKVEADVEADLPVEVMRADTEELPERVSCDKDKMKLKKKMVKKAQKEEKKEEGFFSKIWNAPLRSPMQDITLRTIEEQLKSNNPREIDIALLKHALKYWFVNDKMKKQIKQYLEKHDPFPDNIIRAQKEEKDEKKEEAKEKKEEKAEEKKEKEEAKEEVKEEKKEAKEEKKSEAMKVAQAGVFKTGDRVLVKDLRRTGEVTGIVKVEDKNEILYQVTLHGIPEPKLFSESALEEVKTVQVEAPVSDLENFPATVQVQDEGQAQQVPAMSTARSRAPSFYRAAKKNSPAEAAAQAVDQAGRTAKNPKKDDSYEIQTKLEKQLGLVQVPDVIPGWGKFTDRGLRLEKEATQKVIAAIQQLILKSGEKTVKLVEADDDGYFFVGMPEEGGYAFERSDIAKMTGMPEDISGDLDFEKYVAQAAKNVGFKFRNAPSRYGKRTAKGISQDDMKEIKTDMEAHSQQAGIDKYNESYDVKNLGSGFYKPIKTAETIIKDLTNHRFQTYQDAFENYCSDWSEDAKTEVKMVLARLKVKID